MRSRLDWKRGRWNVNAETTLIHRALRGWQRAVGDRVTYWRWQYNPSEMHAVYDEGTGVGRIFSGPWQLPVLHADHGEAGNSQPRDSGLSVTDRLEITAEFDQLTRVGLTDLDIRHGAYQRDRVAYDGLLYAVQHVDILGQIRRRDMIVRISCVQIRDDELVDDAQFADYLDDPSRLQQGISPREDLD